MENLTAKYGEKKTTIEIVDWDFEQLVKEVYGHHYEIGPCEQHLYESSLQYDNVNGELYFSDEIELEKFKKHGMFEEGSFSKINKEGTMPRAYLLLSDMVNRGILDKGNYTISYGG